MGSPIEVDIPAGILMAQHPFLQIGIPASVKITTPGGFTGTYTVTFTTMSGNSATVCKPRAGAITIENIMLPMLITEAHWGGLDGGEIPE